MGRVAGSINVSSTLTRWNIYRFIKIFVFLGHQTGKGDVSAMLRLYFRSSGVHTSSIMTLPSVDELVMTAAKSLAVANSQVVAKAKL